MLDRHQRVPVIRSLLPTNVSKWYGCLQLFANNYKCSPFNIVDAKKINEYCSDKDFKTRITTLITSMFFKRIHRLTIKFSYPTKGNTCYHPLVLEFLSHFVLWSVVGTSRNENLIRFSAWKWTVFFCFFKFQFVFVL